MKKSSTSVRGAKQGKSNVNSISSSERVFKQLRRDRPMVSVTLRMPEDVLDDLKRIAPALGHSGYQPLIRAYVGRGLREDMAQLEGSEVHALVASLRRRGVDETLISKALADAAEKVKAGS